LIFTGTSCLARLTGVVFLLPIVIDSRAAGVGKTAFCQHWQDCPTHFALIIYPS